MASVYTNDLRLEEIGSGEQSGTWGDTTNTNLELIAEAFSFGTEAITTNADTHTTTIADGSTDPGRSIYLKYTGTLDSACTITLGPNTVSKVWFIENATSGSQNIIISQGSGANVTIGNGAVKMVYSDGAGSGAAVVDALVDLDLTGTTTIAAANISGDLDVDGTANLDVVNIDGAVDMASTLQVDGAITSSSGATITTADNNPQLTLISTDTDANVGPVLDLNRNVTGADDDNLGSITFTAKDDAGNAQTYAKIDTSIRDASNTSEASRLNFHVANNGSVTKFLGFIGQTASAGAEITFNEDSNDIDFRVESNGNANMINVDAGNDRVGIGMIPDTTALTVSGQIGTTNGTASAPTHTFYSDSDTGMFRSGANTLAFATGGTQFLTIASTGAITTNTAGGQNTRLGANAGDSIASGGNYNTLIGDQAGTAITTGDNNVAVGYKALEAEDNYGYNVAVGSESLMTLAATSADAYSTAVGYQSGKLTDTGLYNTFVGAQSGRGNTSASNNVGMGNSSLYTNQLGSNNVAIGVQALNTMNPSTATDTLNTAVGYQAMQDAQTVIQTTAVGGKSLHELTTGNYNVAVGFEALEETTVGDYNTAVGTYALKTNVNGDRSTAFGYGALFSQGPSTATNADYQNVAMGMHAGYNLSTGKKNVFIGYEAANGDGSTKATGDNNVFIGNESGHDITSGGSNTFIGAFTGDAITTADTNTAVGAYSLTADTIGQRTTSIGYGALTTQNRATLTDTISYNTALGYAAGSALTTAQSCTLLGYGAGDSINTGGSNLCVGVSTAQSLTSGEQNCAVGTGALNTDDQGDRTTAIGTSCLYNQNVGDEISYNTAVGYYAGGALSTGKFNTFLGYQAGMTSTNSGTGDSNTAIGYIAGNSMTSAANNVLIGRNAGDLISTGGGNVCVGADTGSTGSANLESGSDNIIIGNLAQVAAHNQSNSICIGHNIAASANDFSFGKASNVVTNDFDTDANWSRSSDVRKKREIYDQNLGLDFINDLRTVSFQWKPSNEFPKEWNDYSEENTMNTDVVMHGFIAQEVKEALDKHASERDSNFSGWKEGEDGMQHTSREMFVIPLIKAVQELSSKVTELQEEIKVLKGE